MNQTQRRKLHKHRRQEQRRRRHEKNRAEAEQRKRGRPDGRIDAITQRLRGFLR